MRDESIGSFLAALAARVPAPGGGATAALHLGQAAALLAMVARYTTGPRYREHTAVVERVTRGADAIRDRALQFAADDVAAFTAVIEAYQLPKSTAAEQITRSAVIENALTGAAKVPAEVIAAATEIVAMAELLLPVSNRSVISDVAAAAEAARAAATTARVNVEINLSGIHDPLERASLVAGIDAVDAVADRACAVTTLVRKTIAHD